uniref:Uncharacterized protein n=1 Tax=Tanacetum cinerariifolium TaxID=118510 RepID=A0A699SY97_TANCI|nr:hypothetical protein [Tanacetum cinerariifolium]GFD02348.1 hypothetical protein [Tanacetum cinerariifolium]
MDRLTKSAHFFPIRENDPLDTGYLSRLSVILSRHLRGTLWSKILIPDVLDRGWRIPTDWPRVNPRNKGKDSPDQAEDASCSGLTKELR